MAATATRVGNGCPRKMKPCSSSCIRKIPLMATPMAGASRLNSLPWPPQLPPRPRIRSPKPYHFRSSQHMAAAKNLTPEEMLALPTGPSQRSTEELDRTRLGGGFRSHGSSYDRPPRLCSDEQLRRQESFNRDSDREFASSRADESDDWAAMKKPVLGNGFERRESWVLLEFAVPS